MNRRDFHRYDVNELGAVNGSSAIVTDISCRGARLIAYKQLKANDRVTVSLEAPDLGFQKTEKQASVVWCSADSGRWICGLDFGMDDRLRIPS